MNISPNLTLVVSHVDDDLNNLLILDKIIELRFKSLSSFAFHYQYDFEQARASIRSLLGTLFTNQRLSKRTDYVLPHNLYSQFIYILDSGEGFDNILSHLVEFGPIYRDACISHQGVQKLGSDVNESVNNAKKLLEQHGYLVFNQLNFLSNHS